MQHITPSSLLSLPSRITYLSAFLSLTPDDGLALLAAKPLIAPLIPTILDAVYSKLLSFDITARAFVPKNTDYEGDLVKILQELTSIQKLQLPRQTRLNHRPHPNLAFWVYLNKVGIMHTGLPGFKHRVKRPELRVEYIHMGLLLGYIVDIVIGAVINIDAIDNEIKFKVMRALNKVIWIQNHLMSRHYLVESDDGNTEVEIVTPPLSDAEGEHVKGGCPFSG
ncbi:uncharacterized protein RSE6_00402 [Rhynchosporium secalis]|uniref:Globin-sensor domain-containing protein n=1 Tax=Rhynchosporium secalis TaxID=38038 RepID=A0A1E1LV67_RHYSE|nr:uncharacterized protein RSE6_00402 [Rhynchosporium secalis]